jgi:hypothetical protein
MRTDLTSCKSVARLAQTILQALNPSYAEHSPAASIDRGVLNSAIWGRSPEEIRELILRNLCGLWRWGGRGLCLGAEKNSKSEKCLKMRMMIAVYLTHGIS